MKLAALAALCVAGLASLANGYPIQKADVVNCRNGPSTSSGIVRTYSKGTQVKIDCQAPGTNIFGNAIWDKTSDGCYVADYYVKTGSDGYVAKRCSAGGQGLIGDDYPYKHNCGGVDPWNYYKCQCTSFVAWRINKQLGVKFHNQYKGTNWGNANSWDNAARTTHVPVNAKPVRGCVAQSNAGRYGHVAWVAKVSGSSVTIEEYNYLGKERYSTRTVPKSTFNYIHIKA
ncbi:hypothetical protein LPJ61_000149 [Coemansia biformis]|uniref:Peptidase C51 domain-containing protein n=1 Tax=Coemansia biformis TaxID=1286918 RepID=A0A9W7YJB7_9FUNG|nr:hypothetical protein LPJ61_000149 [Coemansia biformis]